MVVFLKGWVMNIVIMVLFITLIEILTPTKKLKKQINLISGFILIIAVINPLISLFKGDIDIKGIEISSSNFIDRRDIEEKSKVLKEQQVKQIVELYRNKLINQIETSINDVEGVQSARADIIINEDYSKEDFGNVLRVYIYLKPYEKSSGINVISKIEKIEINDLDNLDEAKSLSTTDKLEKEEDKVDPKTKKMIIEKLKKTFDIQEEGIVINIDKG